jgi:hypothetical protein
VPLRCCTTRCRCEGVLARAHERVMAGCTARAAVEGTSLSPHNTPKPRTHLYTHTGAHTCVTSMVLTQIHLAVSTPNATGRDCRPILRSPSMLLKSLTMAMPRPVCHCATVCWASDDVENGTAGARFEQHGSRTHDGHTHDGHTRDGHTHTENDGHTHLPGCTAPSAPSRPQTARQTVPVSVCAHVRCEGH